MQQYPGNQQPQQHYPYTQPQTPPPPMQPYGAPPPPSRRKRRKWPWIIGVILTLLVISAINAIVSGGNGIGNQSAPTSSQATSAPADQATQADQPTQPAAPSYPPKTLDDLQALAQQGDASMVHEFHSESVGLTGACPQPKRLVTIDPTIKGKQLAEDLLAYFFSNGLDSPCGSIVFAYHSQSEENDAGYTAGRIQLDATGSDGSANLDPNATGLKYTLTLDIGDAVNGQEYVVNYTK